MTLNELKQQVKAWVVQHYGLGDLADEQAGLLYATESVLASVESENLIPLLTEASLHISSDDAPLRNNCCTYNFPRARLAVLMERGRFSIRDLLILSIFGLVYDDLELPTEEDIPVQCPFCQCSEIEIMSVDTEKPWFQLLCQSCRATGPIRRSHDDAWKTFPPRK